MKPNQGVFVNLNDDIKRLLDSGDPNGATEVYQLHVKDIQDKINVLAQIEEVILQNRCLTSDNLDKIKLSILREYVYARCPFFRMGKKSKDIRIIVGRYDIVSGLRNKPSIDDLLNNPTVMNVARTKLFEAMSKEIKVNEEKMFPEYAENE